MGLQGGCGQDQRSAGARRQGRGCGGELLGRRHARRPVPPEPECLSGLWITTRPPSRSSTRTGWRCSSGFERWRQSAWTWSSLGREAEARVSLEETVRVSRRWGLMSSLAPALFYLGWLHARAGNEHEAARSLTEAMRLAEEHEHIHFFSQEASVAVPILALCDRFEAGSFRAGEDRPSSSRTAPELLPEADNRQDLSHRRPARTLPAAGPCYASARAGSHGPTRPPGRWKGSRPSPIASERSSR